MEVSVCCAPTFPGFFLSSAAERCWASCSLLFPFTCFLLLRVWVCIHHLHAWCPWRPEEGISSPRVGVLDSCEPPFNVMWVLGIGPLTSRRTASGLSHESPYPSAPSFRVFFTSQPLSIKMCHFPLCFEFCFSQAYCILLFL